MNGPATVDILIKGGLVITMDSERRILPDADVAIRDRKIVLTGGNLDCEAERVIDARRSAVIPGLINAHMHETLTRGIAEDLPLNRWLAEICFPLDSAYSASVMRGAAMMCQMEMIRGGTTTFLDIYRFPAACAEVAVKSGLRAVFAPQVIVDPPGPGETLESAQEFVVEWLNRDERITPAFGPHAPYSCPPEAYKKLSELAEKHDVPLHTHLSETKWEIDTIRERYSADTPVEHMRELGILSPRMSVAHGVYLTAKDIGLLHEHGVSLVYNPSSNMKLASGVAPIPDLLEAGVKVGLGTDSNLSNNNLDMFEEMRVGAMLQKLERKNAAALPVYETLEMATIGGARALGMEKQIGSIEEGKLADIILVDLDQPHLWPILAGRYGNISEQLVYSANAGDVSHTIVNGQVLMNNRDVLTLDLDEVRAQTREATRELLSEAGMKESYPIDMDHEGGESYA